MGYGNEPTGDGKRAETLGRYDRTNETADKMKPSRRAVLGSIATGSAVLSGMSAGQDSTQTTSTGADSDDGDGPTPPTNLETTAPTSVSGLELSWDGPADPCASAIAYYVVTVDGRERKTVPAGVTRTVLESPGEVVGVYAVDETGAESDEVTVSGGEIATDPLHLASLRPDRETVPVGESVRVGVTARNGVADSVVFDSYEITIEVSTPCTATITDASYVSLDDPETEEPSIADDGTSITLAASDLEVDANFRRLANLELTTHEPRATILEITDVTMVDEGDEIGAVPDWTVIDIGEAERPGPNPPEFIESTAPDWGRGVELQWEGASNPCDASLSHYVLTRDGEQVTTVSAGVTRARFEPDSGDEPHVYGVAAVDDDGTESVAVTTEATVGGTEPELRASVIPRVDGVQVDEIEAGESVPADLVVRPGTDELPDIDDFTAEVEVSTPCATRITDVSYPDAVADADEPEFSPDRDHVYVSAGGFSDGDSDADEVVLATLDLTGLRTGATELHARRIQVAGADAAVAPGDDWTTLSIVPPADDAPPAPSNVDVEQGVSLSIDVFWDGVDDPCDPDLSHYAVSVNGTEERTVPVGVNSTSIGVGGEGPFLVDVITVGQQGNESYPVSDEMPYVDIADPGLLLSVDPPEGTIEPGETVEAPVVLSEVLGTIPTVFSYEITVEVATPCAVQITGASYPSEVSIPEELAEEYSVETVLEYEAESTDEPIVTGTDEPVIADDGSSVTLAVDMLGNGSDEIDLEIATVELTGVSDGHTEITVPESSMESEDPMAVWPRWRTLGVEERSPLPPVGENENPPQDLDGDGLYRDVTGDGQFGSADVTTFFEHVDDPAVTDHAAAYDFNGDGDVGVSDVVALFESL